MNGLTFLQRRILAVLEEPGGYSFPTLTNTVARARGKPNEIDAMRRALKGLLDAGLIAIANARDELSRRWVLLPIAPAVALLDSSKAAVQWSPREGLWVWKRDYPEMEILLTKVGMDEARKILATDGWPDQPLEQYNA